MGVTGRGVAPSMMVRAIVTSMGKSAASAPSAL
jgi:hypothetical protein